MLFILQYIEQASLYDGFQNPLVLNPQWFNADATLVARARATNVASALNHCGFNTSGF